MAETPGTILAGEEWVRITCSGDARCAPCRKAVTSPLRSLFSSPWYERNDHSVPTAYAHRPVLVRGYVGEVVIACGAEVIARHPRSYAREDFVFDPLHYLALLERKPGALDQAAPLQGWALPDEFATLRRLLEARVGKAASVH